MANIKCRHSSWQAKWKSIFLGINRLDDMKQYIYIFHTKVLLWLLYIGL